MLLGAFYTDTLAKKHWKILRICFTLFLLNFGVINHLVAIMVDRVSNISGETAEVHEKLLSKAPDTLIKGLDDDLRLGIGLDGTLSALAAESCPGFG